MDPRFTLTTDPLCPGDLDRSGPALRIQREVCISPTPREEGKGGGGEGGAVWVLDTSGSGGPDQFPDGMDGLRNALTMEERCMVLRRLAYLLAFSWYILSWRIAILYLTT